MQTFLWLFWARRVKQSAYKFYISSLSCLSTRLRCNLHSLCVNDFISTIPRFPFMKFASPCVRFAGNSFESIYLTLQFDGMNHFMQFAEPPSIAVAAFVFICILPNTKQQFVRFQLLLFMLCEPRARHGVWIWNFSCLQNKQRTSRLEMMEINLALPSTSSSMCEMELMARGVDWIREPNWNSRQIDLSTFSSL